eukprot:110020-Pleurochrysis_carterae.AAC.1
MGAHAREHPTTDRARHEAISQSQCAAFAAGRCVCVALQHSLGVQMHAKGVGVAGRRSPDSIHAEHYTL